jgi:hypothetical protein
MRRSSLIAALLTFVALMAGARTTHAEVLTFQLTVGDVLASVGKTNATLVSLGKQARGVKLVPGGTKFAGLTCAGFGDVYKLGSIRVLDGTAAGLYELVTTKRGKDAQSLAMAFGAVGITTWTPPATDAETDQQFWSPTNVSHGLLWKADGMTSGNDDGLLGAAASTKIFRFRANVPGLETLPPGAPYRFLVELIGRTASTDAGLVAFGEQRCITYVDLVPVDVGVLSRLVNVLVTDPYVQAGLAIRVSTLETALENRDFVTALDVMAYIMGHLVARTPEHSEPAVTRRVVAGVYDVRRGLDFRPVLSQCGNGVRETGEACDGADLGGSSCESIGYMSGTLTCQSSCLFDFSQCVANPVCGNGIVEFPEECDNGAQNSDTIPDACRTTCKRAFCGDGVIDLFEDCEDGNLGGYTCQDLGYDGGTLKCDPTWCEFDDERCRLEDD